jgi:hypothetical protein
MTIKVRFKNLDCDDLLVQIAGSENDSMLALAEFMLPVLARHLEAPVPRHVAREYRRQIRARWQDVTDDEMLEARETAEAILCHVSLSEGGSA